MFTKDGGVYEFPSLRQVGIDVVAALKLLRKYPDIAGEPMFDCIRPYVDTMLSHMKEAE